MKAFSLGAAHVTEALRVVAALGSHRYLAGRLHLVHAIAFGAAAARDDGVLDEGAAWARGIIDRARSDGGVDLRSRAEILWRKSTEVELAAVLDAFWTPGDRAKASRDTLRTLLDELGFEARPVNLFDESLEPGLHPLLVDAGWELLPLRDLDPARHQGAISAFGGAQAFAAACSHAEPGPPPSNLLELPAMGAAELLFAADDKGMLCEPMFAWADANETYLDYVLRGVRRAARLPERDG